jgi:hypothetical protein
MQSAEPALSENAQAAHNDIFLKLVNLIEKLPCNRSTNCSRRQDLGLDAFLENLLLFCC